jgi:dipeptidyl-peptidase-4
MPTCTPSRVVHRRTAVVLAAAFACVLSDPGGRAQAQTKRLTLDALFDPAVRIDATGSRATGFEWIDNDQLLWTTRDADGRTEWVKGRVGEDTTSPFYDARRLETALAQVDGVDAGEAGELARPRRFTFDPVRRAALLTVADDLFHYEFATGKLVRLTNDPLEEQDAAFSPDGRLVAFTRAHNLFVVDVAGQQERALTADGNGEILNGRLDYVYQEEVYGRGNFRAFWWSPDSERLAFLQLDERPVPEFAIVGDVQYRPPVEVFDYPKAGDPNPHVRIGVVRVAGGRVTWVDTARYSAADSLVVRVSWHPNGREVAYQVQDREQTWLDLNLSNAASGSSRLLFRETTKAWVDPQGEPAWLDSGDFLWLSERDGWRHLYLYDETGSLQRQVTSGEWEVRRLYGADAEGRAYFAATARSPIGLDLYRVGTDGSPPVRLSEMPGTHRAIFNEGFTYFVGTWSDVTTPPQARLHRSDGSVVRVLDLARVEALDEYRLARPEFVQVKARDGFVMEAMLIRPPDFDASRRYPVYHAVYGGPQLPQVRDEWGGVGYFYYQLLAQHGIVVWLCDNRSASGKGAVSAWPAYKRLGETELADIEDGLEWLGQHEWIDSTRIGISGWSYGGFLVGYALTHSSRFAMGIAGGSVTDWRNYDSIFTERYMLTPQNNPDGYARSALGGAAASLRGRLLLVHGSQDDNVHVQNTLQFAHALQKAGKPFELMIYPTQRHSVIDGDLAKHMRETMFDFVLRTLAPDR